MTLLKRFQQLMWRSWFYFRAGYGTYIALLIGYASNIVVLFKLGVQGNRYLDPIFPTLGIFTIAGVLISVPVAILLGLYHVKRTGAYAADAALSTESNPYVYKAIPGKEREVFMPLWILTAKGLARIMEQQKTLSVEEKEEFDRILTKADMLLQGKMVGHPRDRVKTITRQ